MFGGGFGIPEFLIAAIIALLVFGPSKIPAIGKGLGKAIRNFRSSANELDGNGTNPKKPEDVKKES